MCACRCTCIFVGLYVLASTSFRLNITHAPQPEFKRIPSSRSLGGSSAQLQPCPPPPSASPSPWAQFGVKHLKPLVAFVLQQRHNIAAAALGARRVLLLQSAAYSGEAANLVFYQQIDETDHWGPGYSEFVSTDCSGTPHARSSSLSTHVPPGTLGNYYQPKGAELYRFSGTASSVTINSIYYQWDGTCNAYNTTGLRHAGVLVGTVSTAFPFYIKEVPASAPLLPLWAFASIAGGIVLSGGGAIVMRGRRRQ